MAEPQSEVRPHEILGAKIRYIIPGDTVTHGDELFVLTKFNDTTAQGLRIAQDVPTAPNPFSVVYGALARQHLTDEQAKADYQAPPMEDTVLADRIKQASQILGIADVAAVPGSICELVAQDTNQVIEVLQGAHITPLPPVGGELRFGNGQYIVIGNDSANRDITFIAAEDCEPNVMDVETFIELHREEIGHFYLGDQTHLEAAARSGNQTARQALALRRYADVAIGQATTGQSNIPRDPEVIRHVMTLLESGPGVPRKENEKQYKMLAMRLASLEAFEIQQVEEVAQTATGLPARIREAGVTSRPDAFGPGDTALPTRRPATPVQTDVANIASLQEPSDQPAGEQTTTTPRPSRAGSITRAFPSRPTKKDE